MKPLKILKKSGYRITNQRRQIIEFFKNSKDSLTINDIFKLLKQKGDIVHSATIYRFINLLLKENIIVNCKDSKQHSYQLIKPNHELNLKQICLKCHCIKKIQLSKSKFLHSTPLTISYGFCVKCQ